MLSEIADWFNVVTVVPMAFKSAARSPSRPEKHIRHACRDLFRESRLLKNIIPAIGDVLSAGGIELPKPPEESVPPAIPNPESIGDEGQRSGG